MPYDSIVCVKQVPDTANISAEALKEDGTINRAALPAIVNPEDLHALETALEVRDRYGGTVTVLSMGPPKAAAVLRECLYRGANRAILLTDRLAAASDTLATGFILSQAIRKVGRFDLVFCGRQAIDGDTAQVGPQCAEKLGIPQITYLQRVVDLDGERIRVQRSIGHGWEIVEARLPVLLTVSVEANRPRPPGAKRVFRFKHSRTPSELNDVVQQAPPGVCLGQVAERYAALGLFIEQWNLDDIEADPSRCGLAGSPTRVHRVQSVVLTKDGYHEVAATEEGIQAMVHELIVDRVWS